MRIVFIIDQVYLHGGIERVLSIKANYFASQKGYEVFILTTEQKNKEACYHFDQNIVFEDLDVNYNRSKAYFHPVNLLKLPRHISKTKKAIRKIKPDVVVVCSHSTDTYFVPFINKKIPKVKEFHYSKFIEEYKRKNPGNLFKKLFLRFADYVETKYDTLVILNKDEDAYYESDNTTVIPNPLTFYPDNVSTLESKKVISAGRIAQVKGYDLLVDIWAKLMEKNDSWTLHIYGKGLPEYEKQLQKQINDKGLQNSVFLEGSTDDIQGKMNSSSIFAMTSHNECFPLVLLEAQACGLPIVAFDCPHGPRNIIDSSNGILVPHYDNDAFAEQLLELMEDDDRLQQMGENARKNATKYRLELVMNQWEQMFKSLIN